MTLIDDAYATLNPYAKLHSEVSNPGGFAMTSTADQENSARDAELAQWQAQQAAQQSQRQGVVNGFMSNMGWRPGSTMFGSNSGPMVAPPPAGWAYTPGKGTGWQTPQHTIQNGPDLQSQNWSYSPDMSTSPFKGNRI